MKKTLAIVALGLLVSAAMADTTWYVRGDFNGWGTGNPMTWDAGNNRYAANVDISSQTPGSYFEFKVGLEDWSVSYPGSNHKSKYPAQSSLNFYYYPGAQADGWVPASDRVGYDIAGSGWEVMGSMNDWTTPFPMTDLGNGFYQTDIAIAAAGNYEFKMRMTGDWECSVGSDFGKWASNTSFTAGANETYRFQLDLPGGRLRAFLVPEPASLLGLSLLGLLIRRR